MEETLVVPVEHIQLCDVLLGRGKSVHYHGGNVAYRAVIQAKSRAYYRLDCCLDRDAIAHDIIRLIQSRGGRFLRCEGPDNTWVQCSYSVTRSKVKQALRDAAKNEKKPARQNTAAGGSSNVTTRPMKETCAQHNAMVVNKGNLVRNPASLSDDADWRNFFGSHWHCVPGTNLELPIMGNVPRANGFDLSHGELGTQPSPARLEPDPVAPVEPLMMVAHSIMTTPHVACVQQRADSSLLMDSDMVEILRRLRRGV